MISWNVRIGAKRSAEGNVSCLPFDTCRAEIYRRQRNSCWSRCTRATSPADHPARKLPSPDKPEHRRSEEHTSELQSPDHLVCRLLLEKKKPTEHLIHISCPT